MEEKKIDKVKAFIKRHESTIAVIVVLGGYCLFVDINNRVETRRYTDHMNDVVERLSRGDGKVYIDKKIGLITELTTSG